WPVSWGSSGWRSSRPKEFGHSLHEAGMKISFEHWDDLELRYEEVEATRFEEIEAVIRCLDQKEPTVLYLGERGQSVLTIGGGTGDFVVLWMTDEDHWLSLKAGPRDGTKKRITVGGQPGDYESALVATFDQALAAARYFFLHQKL